MTLFVKVLLKNNRKITKILHTTTGQKVRTLVIRYKNKNKCTGQSTINNRTINKIK